MKICNSCGANNKGDFKFCIKCGTDLSIQNVNAKSRFCSYCGKENGIDSKFCISCGKNLFENVQQKSNNTNYNSPNSSADYTKKALGTIVAIISSIFLLIGLINLVRSLRAIGFLIRFNIFLFVLILANFVFPLLTLISGIKLIQVKKRAVNFARNIHFIAAVSYFLMNFGLALSIGLRIYSIGKHSVIIILSLIYFIVMGIVFAIKVKELES